MIDIRTLRENTDLVRESELKRFKDPENVDLALALDIQWRKQLKTLEALRKDRNLKARQIGEFSKEKKEIPDELLAENRKIKSMLKDAETKIEALMEKRNKHLASIGNLLHPDVPISQDEEGFTVQSTFGKITPFSFEVKTHGELVEILGGADVQRASKATGARFYYLLGDIMFLNLALIQYGLNYLTKKENGYTACQPPYLLNKEHMEGAAELSDFAETLYKIEGRDLYLIATSEQAIVALHSDEVIPENDLPLRYAGFSTNFRREAHRENLFSKGIFRVHQFEKVEQLVFCRAEDSWDEHTRMVNHATFLLKNLDLPGRVIEIPSGDLNDAAARKYDVEVWFPAQNKYRELCSISNVTDFQSRHLNIRTGNYGGDKEYVHILNGTAIATERTICSILENNQLEDGSVELPKVLREYMGGKEVIHPRNLPPGS